MALSPRPARSTSPTSGVGGDETSAPSASKPRRTRAKATPSPIPELTSQDAIDDLAGDTDEIAFEHAMEQVLAEADVVLGASDFDLDLDVEIERIEGDEPDEAAADPLGASAARAGRGVTGGNARGAARAAQHVAKSTQRVTPRPRSSNAPPEGEFERLFALWRETGDPALRDRLILMHRNLVTYLARRFTDRGEMYEDIIQQGLIGLINALDHFDPKRGVRFATFATPTIVGEIRRYFRDKTWSVRVPRRLQELHQTINKRIEALTQELNRSPTYSEIARALGVEEEDVVEAMEMSQALDPTSLDETSGVDDGNTAPIAEQVGSEDAALDRVNEFSQLESALDLLPERQRRVLKLAYFDQLSQAEIAKEIKVSPMHVSRLQRRALTDLREILENMEDAERKRQR